MARTYGKLLVSIWEPGSDFRELTASAQRLYKLLLSHPSTSAAGVLLLQPKQWARFASDTTERQIDKALAELEQHPSRKVIVDRETDEVLVRAFIRSDGGYVNTNMLKAIRKAIDLIESDALTEIAEDELTRALGMPKGTPS